MGDLLRDMMNERADTHATPELDVDAIIRAGDRRVWRRRTIMGVGAAAAVVTLAITAPAVLDSVREDSTPPVADQPTRPSGGGFETRTTTYAIGTSLYYGEQAIDVSPYDVSAFVQTDDGFVVAATDGTVVLADGDSVKRIGTAVDQPGYATLAADDSGSYVTWVDTSEGVAHLVVYDTATDSELWFRNEEPDVGSEDKPREFERPLVEAFDGSTAYWHRSDGTAAHDLDTGRTTMLAQGASPRWLKDVAGGYLARSSFDDLAVVVTRDLDDESTMVPGHNPDANLSPEGTLLAAYENGELAVTEVATGADVTPHLDAGSLGNVVQWVDDQTFVAVGRHGTDADPVDLVECAVASGACETTASQAGLLNSIVFPDGR